MLVVIFKFILVALFALLVAEIIYRIIERIVYHRRRKAWEEYKQGGWKE